MGTLIPEIEIYKILNQMVKITSENLKSETDSSKTIIGRIFGVNSVGEEMRLDTFEFIKQSKHVFSADEAKRKIGISVGYNFARVETGYPHLHILLPSESPVSAPIGMNEGYAGSFVNGDISTPILTNASDVTYNIMITTDNVNEMILIYHWLKACSVTFYTQFELRGMQNVKIGGNDMQFNDELVPPNIFHRNFNLSFTYDYYSVDLFGHKMFNGDFKVELKAE